MANKKNSSLGCGVLNFVLIILVLFSLCIDGLFIYFKFFNKDITLGVNYWGDQSAVVKSVDGLSENERKELDSRCILEANVYSNNKNNGIELQELKINYFMDYTLNESSYRSSGMQYVGNAEELNTELTAIYSFWANLGNEDDINNYISNSFNYYDTTSDITWSGNKGSNSVATKFNREEVFIIKIKNEAYAIQLNKKVKYNSQKLWFWEIHYQMDYANWGQLFQCIMHAVKTNDKGYSDGYIILDLSDFFSIKKYDQDSGKFLSDDVTNIIKNYAVLKYHYDSNGAKTSNQSMFGAIECNNTYGLTDEEKNTEYWQERVVFNFTEKDLQTRYSEVVQGNLLSLDFAIKNKFATYKRAKINVVINVTSDNRIAGLDFDALKGINVDTVTINGNGVFRLYSGSLIDTNINKIVRTSTIMLVVDDGATNNIYEEVIK